MIEDNLTALVSRREALERISKDLSLNILFTTLQKMKQSPDNIYASPLSRTNDSTEVGVSVAYHVCSSLAGLFACPSVPLFVCPSVFWSVPLF